MVIGLESREWKGEKVVNADSEVGDMPNFGAELLAKRPCSNDRSNDRYPELLALQVGQLMM